MCGRSSDDNDNESSWTRNSECDGSEVAMARRPKDLKELKIERPPRIKLSAKESIKRTKEFEKRRDRFIAAVASQSDG